jgi:hypothetical protein
MHVFHGVMRWESILLAALVGFALLGMLSYRNTALNEQLLTSGTVDDSHGRIRMQDASDMHDRPHNRHLQNSLIKQRALADAIADVKETTRRGAQQVHPTLVSYGCHRAVPLS